MNFNPLEHNIVHLLGSNRPLGGQLPRPFAAAGPDRILLLRLVPEQHDRFLVRRARRDRPGRFTGAGPGPGRWDRLDPDPRPGNDRASRRSPAQRPSALYRRYPPY